MTHYSAHLVQFLPLPPRETWRYVISAVVAGTSYFLAFALVFRLVVTLRGCAPAGTGKLIARLATWLAALWFATGLGYVLFIAMMFAGSHLDGTVRNYLLSTMTLAAAWVIRGNLQELVYRMYRPDSVDAFLSHLRERETVVELQHRGSIIE
jgi:hypothetical protein